MTIQTPTLLRLCACFAVVLLGSSLVFAQNDLLNHSAWAIATQATMDDPQDVRETSEEVPNSITHAGQPNQGNSNAGPNERWDGQIGKTRMGHLATIPVLVRWDSAAVIRKALTEQHDANVADFTASANDHFILTVVGLLPAKGIKGVATIAPKSSNNEDDTTQARSAEEILEWFMANSLILLKGQPSLRPENVKVDADTGTLHLYFPRSEKFATGKHELLFATRYGSMAVQAKFRVKDMTVNGQPDL